MRYENWEIRLQLVIDMWRKEKFIYGISDCCAFVAECVRAQTGIDYYKDWMGQYNDARSAAKLIREKGFDNLREVLTKKFGQPMHISRAMHGDIVFADLSLDAPQIGICQGVMSLSCAPGGQGLEIIQTLHLQEAFNV